MKHTLMALFLVASTSVIGAGTGAGLKATSFDVEKVLYDDTTFIPYISSVSHTLNKRTGLTSAEAEASVVWVGTRVIQTANNECRKQTSELVSIKKQGYIDLPEMTESNIEVACEDFLKR